MTIVQPTAFAPYPKSFAEKQINGHDLTEDPSEMAVVLHRLKQFFDLDLSKVEIRGWLDSDCRGLCVSLTDSNDQTERDVRFSDSIDGQIFVKAKEGSTLDCIGRDVMGDAAKVWLEGLGYPQGYPYGCECVVTLTSLSMEPYPLK